MLASAKNPMDGEITSVQLDTSSKKQELPEKLPFESCQMSTKTNHAVIVETVEPRIKQVSETTMSKVAPFTERGCFGCGGKDPFLRGRGGEKFPDGGGML